MNDPVKTSEPPAQESPPAHCSFSAALVWLKRGGCVRREGWNGKGMFLFLVPDGVIDHPAYTGPLLPCIAMKTVQGTAGPWLASQTDILADDWQRVPY